MSIHLSQYYWHNDWLGRKSKAWYFGPRIEWMKLVKEKKKKKKNGTHKKNN